MSEHPQQKPLTPPESYSEAKGFLWGQYMANITPKLKDFQQQTRNACLQMREMPKHRQVKLLRLVDTLEKEYVKFCILEFTKYIESLQLAYVKQALKDNGIETEQWQKAVSKNIISAHKAQKISNKKSKQKKKEKIPNA